MGFREPGEGVGHPCKVSSSQKDQLFLEPQDLQEPQATDALLIRLPTYQALFLNLL